MEPREIELQQTVPKSRNRKISAFDRISREEDIGEVEGDGDESIAPSASFREISRQHSGNIRIAVDSSGPAYEYFKYYVTG